MGKVRHASAPADAYEKTPTAVIDAITSKQQKRPGQSGRSAWFARRLARRCVHERNWLFKEVTFQRLILPMPADPLSILKTVYGYDTFRGWQREIIEHVIAGNHAFVLMPTGGGKSLCYQIPALMHPGIGLVISPSLR
jgi:superfamily II DNA helicase RecQ